MILTPIKRLAPPDPDEVTEVPNKNPGPTGTPLLVVRTMGETYTIHADQPLSADVPAPSTYQVPPTQSMVLQPPAQPVPPDPEPQPVPQVQAEQRDGRDHGFKGFCVLLAIIITFATFIAIYFIITGFTEDTFDIKLVRKVKMYPNHDGMGDIKLTNLDTNGIGIIDGTDFGINEVR